MNSHNKSYNVNIISRFVIIALVLMTIIEAVAHPAFENVYGCLTFIVAWLSLSKLVMVQKDINKCFLPFMSLFGLGVCFYFLPLAVTLVEGKPLTFRFSCPYETFNFQLLNLLMLILAYRVCLRIYSPNNIVNHIWDKIGFFYAPTDNQIWALGIIGVFSQLFQLSVMGTDDADAENLGVLGQVLDVIKVFASFPVMLLFKHLYNSTEPYKRGQKLKIVFYLILISGLALATGKRTAIFSAFVTMAMCFIVPIFSENKKIFNTKTFIYFMLGAYLVTGPVADLAAAMALGRDNQENTSSSKTFNNIISLYQDKETLHTLYQAFLTVTDNGGDNLSGWSEYYVDNIMLDRFCNLRVCDMTIDYAQKLGFDNPTMHEYMQNQVLFLLPTPILNAIGVHINKFESQYTPGDLLSMESLKIGRYHGYRVAGDVGIGLYLWGYAYFIFAFIIFVVFFFYLSSLTRFSPMGFLILPIPVLAGLFRYFLQFNNGTGIVGIVSIVLRTGWQAVVLYCLIMFVIKRIIR